MHSKYSHISVREIIRNPISMFGLEGGNHVVKIFTDNSARGNTQVIFLFPNQAINLLFSVQNGS